MARGDLKEVPLKIYGGRCPLECKFCPQGTSTEKQTHCTLEELDSLIDDIELGTVAVIGKDYEPFQAQESRYRLVEHAIARLNERGICYRIITRNPMALPKAGLVTKIDRGLASVEISINIFNDGKYIMKGEEWGPYPSQREYIAEKLFVDGYDVAIRVSPFRFDDVDFHELAGLRTDKLIIEYGYDDKVVPTMRREQVRRFYKELPGKDVFVDNGKTVVTAKEYAFPLGARRTTFAKKEGTADASKVSDAAVVEDSSVAGTQGKTLKTAGTKKVNVPTPVKKNGADQKR